MTENTSPVVGWDPVQRATEQPTRTVYHWIITVRLHDGTHAQLNNRVAITGSTTRSAMFAWAQKQIFEQLGTDNAAVVFFDLAPDDMPGGTPAPIQP